MPTVNPVLPSGEGPIFGAQDGGGEAGKRTTSGFERGFVHDLMRRRVWKCRAMSFMTSLALLETVINILYCDT